MSDCGSTFDACECVKDAYTNRVNLYYTIEELRGYAYGYNNPAIIDLIRDCLDDIYYCLQTLLQYEGGCLYKPILANWIYNTGNGAPEITYQAICEAWGRNNFEGRAVTIAFIDRMRQILWNEPYSAIWASHPEQ